MTRDEKYGLSYPYFETFSDKLERLEKVPLMTYPEEMEITDNPSLAKRMPLFHGLRFSPLETLESIFQSKAVLCGREVSKLDRGFSSYDGFENCNLGEYVSVMPYQRNDLEFLTFIQENVFLVFSGDLPARRTLYLNFDDYVKLRKKNEKTKNLYSYAFHEYMVPDSIPLESLMNVGVYSKYLRERPEEVIPEVEKLMKKYEISVPFRDYSTGRDYFPFGEEKTLIKK